MKTYLKHISITLHPVDGMQIHMEICQDRDSLIFGATTDTHRAWLPASELSPEAQAFIAALFDDCVRLAPDLMPILNGSKVQIQMESHEATKARFLQAAQQTPEPMGA